jgi:hypothetical protein
MAGYNPLTKPRIQQIPIEMLKISTGTTTGIHPRPVLPDPVIVRRKRIAKALPSRPDRMQMTSDSANRLPTIRALLQPTAMRMPISRVRPHTAMRRVFVTTRHEAKRATREIIPTNVSMV